MSDETGKPQSQPEQAADASDAAAKPEAQSSQPDRAAAEGLPPDSGPEQRVMLVSEAMMRSRPMVFFAHVLVVIAGLVGLVYFRWIRENPVTWAAWLSLFLVGATLVSLGVWKIKTLTHRLEITNKRTVRRIGLFSRDTSEVLHDHVRNVEVQQSLWERIWGVGRLGISSSGQDGIEISMERVPKPGEVRRIIDLYRPLD